MIPWLGFLSGCPRVSGCLSWLPLSVSLGSALCKARVVPRAPTLAATLKTNPESLLSQREAICDFRRD